MTPPSRRRLLAAFVAALAIVVPSGPLTSTNAAGFAGTGPDPAPAADAPRPAFAEIDRAMILDLVSRHRVAADVDWRRQLADAVYTEAVEAGIDPLMVAAIVAKESSFRTRAVSRAGAVGLMQIRPFVGRHVAERTDLEWRGVETLHHPELNVRLGILYYQEMVERFHGDFHIALAAYNRGPSRVSGELRQGTFSASRYAQSVLRLYRRLDAQRLSRLSAVAQSASGALRAAT